MLTYPYSVRESKKFIGLSVPACIYVYVCAMCCIIFARYGVTRRWEAMMISAARVYMLGLPPDRGREEEAKRIDAAREDFKARGRLEKRREAPRQLRSLGGSAPNAKRVLSRDR